MAGARTTLAFDDKIATLTLDDGKRNALAPEVLDDIYAALDEVEKSRASSLIITGREGVLSAGFDLKVMNKGGVRALKMLRGGYGLTARLLSFPAPVVIASPGHAYAMGAFMLLSGDYRFGVRGPYTYVANEVALGIPMPRTGIEVLRLRLTPAARERAVALAEEFSPEQALAVGFIDALVSPEELMDAARAKARALSALDAGSHTAAKLRLRRDVLQRIRSGIQLDLVEAVAFGSKRALRASLGRGSRS